MRKLFMVTTPIEKQTGGERQYQLIIEDTSPSFGNKEYFEIHRDNQDRYYYIDGERKELSDIFAPLVIDQMRENKHVISAITLLSY